MAMQDLIPCENNEWTVQELFCVRITRANKLLTFNE